MATRQASCSCGQLRVSTEGEPTRVGICHCLACQQRSGSAFAFHARFPRDCVQISGETRQYTRHADEDGEARTHSFCPTCGSTVTFVGESEPELVAVAVGAFADPGFPPPTYSVWEARRHGWVERPASVVRFQD